MNRPSDDEGIRVGMQPPSASAQRASPAGALGRQGDNPQDTEGPDKLLPAADSVLASAGTDSNNNGGTAEMNMDDNTAQVPSRVLPQPQHAQAPSAAANSATGTATDEEAIRRHLLLLQAAHVQAQTQAHTRAQVGLAPQQQQQLQQPQPQVQVPASPLLQGGQGVQLPPQRVQPPPATLATQYPLPVPTGVTLNNSTMGTAPASARPPPPPPLSATDQTLLAARARAEAELLARSAAVALERRQVELQMAQVRAQAQAQAQQVQMGQLIEVEARAIQQALVQAQAGAQAAGAQVPVTPAQAPISHVPAPTQPAQVSLPPPTTTTADDEHDDIHNLPTFTAEDERRELSNLTPEDILQLRRDMLGLTNHLGGMGLASSAGASSSSTAGGSGAMAASSASPAMGGLGAALSMAAGTATTTTNSPTGREGMDSLLRRRERQIRAEADLQNLQSELDAIPTGEKVAYLLAIGPDKPCHAEATGRNAQGRNRHMAYLEGCNFDARAAARKIVQYWTERLELFGPAKAFERMSLHGAMKGEIDWMIQSSIAQTLPYRDRSGRTIVFGDPSRRDATVYSTHRQNMAMWYLLETIIEDEESRNRGLVVLTSAKAYSTGSGMDLNFSRFTRKAISEIFPVHLRSIHFCHPSKVAHYVIFPALKFVLGKEMRLRFNTHYGTDAEVLLQLEAFGLHRSILSAELCGDVQLDFRKWIHQRLSQEHSAEALEVGAPGTTSSAVPGAAAIAASVATSISGGSDVDGLEALSLAAAVAQPVTEGAEEKPQKSWRDLKFKRKPKRKLSQIEETSTAGEAGTVSSALPSPLNHAGNPVNPNRQVPFKLNRQSKKDLIDLEEVLNDTETPKSGKKKVGRRADPRMNRAVRIKLRNPEITPFDALLQGGYDYPTPVKGSSAHEIFDSDNVSLHQRKNQLCRRVRQLREKQTRDEAKAAKAAG